MSDFVIKVSHLSKRYRIGKAIQSTNHKSSLLKTIVSPFQYLTRTLSKLSQDETIWALKDVSFEVEQGKVVGIIGRNGAGKSTLLKILSRITEPTQGKAEIKGRVAALLEVGTGFHPELTGRENIYLSGAILGMKRGEIERKFDEIVDFSGVEKFIETPIKYYSSGMRVRLGFAVAAHLEPEVLMVDEVLAVGDAEFQKKCLGKMGEVAKEGRTVLFVSHNMGAVQTLCSRGIFLHQGEVHFDGSATDAVSTYLRTIEQNSHQGLQERIDRRGKGDLRLVHVEISTGENLKSTTLITGRPARFEFHISDTFEEMVLEYVDFTIYDLQGHPIVYFNSAERGLKDSLRQGINRKVICDVEELLLVPGRYRINVGIKANGDIQDHVEAAAFFNVEGGNVRGQAVAAKNQRPGSVCFPHRWMSPPTS